MKNKIDVHKAGLTFGGMLGFLHLIWSALISLGVAQALADKISTLHMVEPHHVLLPFSLGSAVTLIVVASILGYIFGYVLATIWNATQK